ncbi:alpha,alpha-trehalase TreF [Candidatus Saccharibacteria bacterium]|nr:alpha,alpha-trehalase TreF [Candidatus Saccharibacteria bacterium]
MAKQNKPVSHKVKTALVKTTGQLLFVAKSPDEQLGDLFSQVQARRVYDDGKTFVDLVPKKRVRQIVKEYNLVKQDPNFDLGDFVSRHFYEFAPHKENEGFIMSPAQNPREHVRQLWMQLERRNRKDRGSLVAVPHEYVVPGGRFSEQFYWDSYFIMLGLAADGYWHMIDGMVRNYAYMIRKFGFIPTANRTYFLSRSQPPFFSHMVKLLGTHRGSKRTMVEYLPAMLSEYRFWMRGSRTLTDSVSMPARDRVVRMPNGAILNRYYDNKTTPRPESQLEDIETAERARNANKQKIFLDLRAAAESGWDFSSRWFKNAQSIESIYTTDIVPVDLNCLLYELEKTIGDTYAIMKQSMLAKKFHKFAERRAEAIRTYCWDENERFFMDYDFREGRSTAHVTLAGVFPLYSGVASSEQARLVAERLERDFLKPGGLVMTLIDNGQQWDAPNGWAPLQWVAIVGLRNYGYHELAEEIKQRWIKTTEYVFSTRHKMIEKYDVVDESRVGGGGEYPLQDGFGWTNGVYAALKDEDTPIS